MPSSFLDNNSASYLNKQALQIDVKTNLSRVFISTKKFISQRYLFLLLSYQFFSKNPTNHKMAFISEGHDGKIFWGINYCSRGQKDSNEVQFVIVYWPKLFNMVRHKCEWNNIWVLEHIVRHINSGTILTQKALIKLFFSFFPCTWIFQKQFWKA